MLRRSVSVCPLKFGLRLNVVGETVIASGTCLTSHPAPNQRSITHLHALLGILRQLGSHATDDHRNGLYLRRINGGFVSDLSTADPSREFNLSSLIIDS